MSTKSTIVCGENFHLYEEGFDDTGVYLWVDLARLDDVRHEVGRNHITLRLPLSLWDVIREHTIAGMAELRGQTDEQIREIVQEAVHGRRHRWRAALADRKGWQALWGMGVYGDVEDPVAQQIQRGIEHHMALRDAIQLIPVTYPKPAEEGAER